MGFQRMLRVERDTANAWMGLLRLYFGPENSSTVSLDAAMLHEAFGQCRDEIDHLEELADELATARSSRGDLRLTDAVSLYHDGKLGLVTAPPRFTDASLMEYARAVVNDDLKGRLVGAFCTARPSTPSHVWVNAVLDTGRIVSLMADVRDLTPLSESGD